MNFNFLLPTRIIMEPGLRQRVGKHLNDHGCEPACKIDPLAGRIGVQN